MKNTGLTFSSLIFLTLLSFSKCLAVPAATGHSALPNAYETALAEGKSLLTGKEFAHAQKVFEAILVNNQNLKSRTRHQAQLLLAKSLFSQHRLEKASELLESLLLNPSDNGLNPAVIYEASFDLAVCRAGAGKSLDAALDFLNIGQSAAPSGQTAIRQLAIINAKLITCTRLDSKQTEAMLRIAKNTDLKAFLMNDCMEKYLKEKKYDTFNTSLSLVDNILLAPDLSEQYRPLLESLKKQASRLAGHSFEELKTGIILPIELSVYNSNKRLPIGNEIFTGIYSRILDLQIKNSGLLINFAVAETEEEEKDNSYNAAKKIISGHKPEILIGPVFSKNTVEVARAAINAAIPLITPTATDNIITDGNSWCFQLNPTHEERGRIAAREMLYDRRVSKIAVLSEQKDYLRKMTDGFLDELKKAGIKTLFYTSINGKISGIETLDTQTGNTFDAVYLPLASPETIEKALNMLAEKKIGYLKLFGSGIWSEEKVIKRFKGKLPQGITFFTDFYVDNASDDVQKLLNRNRAYWNHDLSSDFWYGYDTLDYLLTLLEQKKAAQGKQNLAAIMMHAPAFKAHYTQFLFEGNNVNRYMNVLRYENGTIKRIR